MANEYEGKAIITGAYTKALDDWQAHPKSGPGLTEDEVETSFNIVFSVKIPSGDEFTLDPIEVSPRELTGKLLEVYASRVQGRQPTQIDVALSTLHRAKLISEPKLDNVFEAMNTVGREINIKRFTSESNGKSYTHTQIQFGPKKLSNNELMAKLARLQGKPAPAQSAPADSMEEAPF